MLWKYEIHCVSLFDCFAPRRLDDHLLLTFAEEQDPELYGENKGIFPQQLLRWSGFRCRFSSFYATSIRNNYEFEYEGLAHRAGELFLDVRFEGDENAIVDLKYSSDPRLTWWFDHHQSAFLSHEDEDHFRADKSGKKFHDPTYRSCTKFIAEMLRWDFGFDSSTAAGERGEPDYPAEPERIDVVQRLEFTARIPPAMGELTELLQFLRIRVERSA